MIEARVRALNMDFPTGFGIIHAERHRCFVQKEMQKSSRGINYFPLLDFCVTGFVSQAAG